MTGFTCLLLNKKTRFASSVFLAGWAVYLLVTVGASTATYYIASAAIETSIAIILNDRHKYVAYLGYSLIAVNIYGLLVHADAGGRNLYIIIYAAISITQFILLLSWLLPDGIRGLRIQRSNVRGHNYDCGEACDIMRKNTAEEV